MDKVQRIGTNVRSLDECTIIVRCPSAARPKTVLHLAIYSNERWSNKRLIDETRMAASRKPLLVATPDFPSIRFSTRNQCRHINAVIEYTSLVDNAVTQMHQAVLILVPRNTSHS